VARGSTRRYVASKTAQAVATLVFVLLFNFFLFRVMPGSPIDAMARGQRLSPSEKQELIVDLGLDKPLPQQLPIYLWDTVTLNFGESYTSGLPVSQTIGERIWPTFLLIFPSTVIAVVVGVAAGIMGGWFRGSARDVGSLGASLVFYSIPEGWLAMMLLVVFGSILGVLPLRGYASAVELSGTAHIADVLSHLILPTAALALAYVGEVALVMRSSLIEVTGEDYLQTARAKGLSDRMVRRRHAVPNALLPIVTLVFLSIGFVFGGAVIIEAVFTWPGLGLLTFEAIEAQDYPVIQAVFLLSSVTVIAANLLSDLLYGYFDPRVRDA
jgi:peptide/nickel transport system permease protein